MRPSALIASIEGAPDLIIILTSSKLSVKDFTIESVSVPDLKKGLSCEYYSLMKAHGKAVT